MENLDAVPAWRPTLPTAGATPVEGPWAPAPVATAARPLLGLTMLLVEDSRFASDALRLLAQRSGARLRRADSLEAAGRHLRTYRPGAVVVDVGLPDGSGLDLVRALARATPRIALILATSADPATREDALAAGADGFLQKPVLSLAAFQAALSPALPGARALRLVTDDRVTPDPLAYRDDLRHGARALGAEAPAGEPDGQPDGRPAPRLVYAMQFLGGLARAAGDAVVAEAVAAAEAGRRQGPALPEIAALRAVVHARIAAPL
jgi:CheY-like chemotaxis protein